MSFAEMRDRGHAALFAQLPAHAERLRWSAGQVEQHQLRELRRLLALAKERSPFHARRLRDVDTGRFELADLASLPTMTKDEMMASFDDVVTDRTVTLAAVERLLASTASEPSLLNGRSLCLATGGSSGRRGVFVSDMDAMVQFGCSMLRPMAAKLAALGLPFSVISMGLVAAPSAIHATGLIPRLLDGSPIRVTAVPATLPLDEIVRRLNEAAPNVLYGYPSVLARLAEERRAGRLAVTPMAITSTSEHLSDDAREQIESAFGVPVTNTFGSTEGLGGHTEPGESGFTFASDLCIVELLRPDGAHVDVGEVAERVLVTNLYNHIQPLIRYELGDAFVRLSAGEHGHLRADVHGRADPPLRWGDVEVHPIAVRSVLLHHRGVDEYQVVQTPSGLDVSVVGADAVDRCAIARELVSALARSGLPDAHVAVEHVRDLPRLAGSGKLRRFVPLDASDGARLGA